MWPVAAVRGGAATGSSVITPTAQPGCPGLTQVLLFTSYMGSGTAVLLCAYGVGESEVL